MRQPRISQAVVLIHGIGEQKPMDTLRSFVDAVLPDPKQGGEKYFSKPDQMSELFELRKLQNREQPRTHFFEYYWASKVKGTRMSHVLSWLSTLFLRLPWTIPAHLKPLWWMTWGLAATSVGFWIWFTRQGEYSALVTNPPFLVSILATFGLLALQYFTIGYVGDAARYLSPRPGNIALRQMIRADGIKLLRRLHDSGEYERIVVVGHSLGSVIAYDVLTHLWQEMNDTFTAPKRSRQPALRSLEETGEALPTIPSEHDVRDFQAHQLELWKELRDLGNPWLVTDLITIGSPLAHAALLLAHNEENLESRQRQRELPTCPPVTESGGGTPRYSYRVWDKYDGTYGEHVLHALHHAAPFAVTRWTNLFFPVRWGLFGDFVGGPLRPWFGRGILDIAVSHRDWTRRHTPRAHVSYWCPPADTAGASLDRLCAALDCEGAHVFRESRSQQAEQPHNAQPALSELEGDDSQ